MLERNRVYLEGYGSPLGLVYFMDHQGHLGFGKLITFLATLIPFIFLDVGEWVVYAGMVCFIVEQAWNLLIMCDIYMFIHFPGHYEGIGWTPSDEIQHRVYSEGVPSKQESFFMMFGYLVFIIMIIPSLYSSLAKYLLLRRRRLLEDEPYMLV